MKHFMKEFTEQNAAEIAEKIQGLELKDGDEGGSFKVVASTESVDRDGEVIKLNGRDRKHFMTNPVILANHYYKVENIVGKATKIYKRDGKLIVEGVFSKANPLGVLCQKLYEEGMLKSVSVGFIVKQRNEQNREIIEKAELLELSFVAVQSNRDALSLDGKQLELYKKGVEQGLIKEIKEEKKEITLEDVFDLIKSVQGEVQEIKQTMADDKAKKEAEIDVDFIAKEILQDANRKISEGLRTLKNKKS